MNVMNLTKALLLYNIVIKYMYVLVLQILLCL